MNDDRGSSTPEEPFEIDWGAHGQPREVAETLPALPEDGAGAVDVPVEPLPPWERKETEYSAAAALTALREFHAYGRREPHAVPDAGAARPLPALLDPYRDLAAIRFDYPACLTGESSAPVRTLTAIMDDVISSVADDSESGERKRRSLRKLETAIRRHSDENVGATLSEQWRACERIVREAASSEESREFAREALAEGLAALPADGPLLSCTDDTPRRIFLAVAASRWEARCMQWREELDALVARTRNILAADDSHEADIHNPEHLRDATGGEDMDFEAMSGILRRSHLAEPLPESRRVRVQRALDTILRTRPLFDGSTSLFDANARLPFDLQPVRNVCAAVVDRQEARLRVMVDFFKALRIAELEVENLYKESVHDRAFARFDASQLTDAERSLCPPAVLILDDEFFANPDMTGLISLLTSGLPVNVIATLTDLGHGEKRDPATIPGWPARLTNVAAALGDVFVMQGPASQPVHFAAECADGFDYDGPALFCAYAGSTDDLPALPPYLASAAAAECRVFPAWRCNPGRGTTLAARMSIAGNAQIERTWTSGTFAYRKEGGETVSIELAFTPADFLSQDIRFDDDFWFVDPSKWHEKMIPLGDFIRLGAAEASSFVPYLHTVDEDGVIVRVVVTRAILDVVRRVSVLWSGVRESGGVENSFAVAALEGERARLAEEKQHELDALEKKYAADLDRDIGALTEEIVGRIAARLLDEGTGVSGMLAPSAAPVTTPASARSAAPSAPAEDAAAGATPGTPVPEAADDEEDDALSFDDPYIDTPLCTSCNECTKINDRMFGYDENKQAYIKDADAGTFRQMVSAAEKCPVRIIHPGKPRNESESGLEELISRAAPFN